MYYSNQIKEIEKAYTFLEPYNDRNAGLNWHITERVLEDPKYTWFDSFEGQTVADVIKHLQENCDLNSKVVVAEEGTYVEEYISINQTDEEYLDYIVNSFDFRSQYNLSLSWVDYALTFNDQKLHDMAFDLTKRRYDILNSFKKEELVEAEDIVLFLLDKTLFRDRAASLYIYCGKSWDETPLQKKIKEIKLEAFITFDQLRIV
jgi:hypothetical protein